MSSSYIHLLLNLLTLFIIFSPSFQRNTPYPPHTIEFPTIYADGDIPLVPVRIGEPPQTLLLIPDTGSDATWFFCDTRYNGSFLHRTFDRSKSFTSVTIPCSSPSCVEGGKGCSNPQATCDYRYEYVDGTSTSGYWIRENIVVASEHGVQVKLEGLMFGCSSRESSNLTDYDGVLGLSRNWPSFTSQLVPNFGMMFSYTLARLPNKIQDRLVFGKTRLLNYGRDQIQYTKLVHVDAQLYYVEVLRLLIDEEPLDVPESIWSFDSGNGTGGVIMDTGTTFTYVPEVAFRAIHGVYVEFLQVYDHVKVTDTEACYSVSDHVLSEAQFPLISIEFEGGARLQLEEENLFVEDEDGMNCLAIGVIEKHDGSIIGSVMQRGYFWEYDLLNQRVGFAPLL